jgi:hypothetical protein
VAGDFPRSPSLLKGALVSYEEPFLGVVPSVIVFQYNPEELSRSLQTRAAPWEYRMSGEARDDAFLALGPPIESINLTVEIDATDQLEGQNPIVQLRGIQPQLSSLELLMYPRSTQVLLNLAAARAGTWTLQIENTPVVLLVWGAARVLPVRITSLNITEQAFDTMLNPILARVDLGLQVMTYLELRDDNIGNGVYMSMMVQREVLARLGGVAGMESLPSGLIPT